MRDGVSKRENPGGLESQFEFLKLQNLSGSQSSSLKSQFPQYVSNNIEIEIEIEIGVQRYNYREYFCLSLPTILLVTPPKGGNGKRCHPDWSGSLTYFRLVTYQWMISLLANDGEYVAMVLVVIRMLVLVIVALCLGVPDGV